MCGISKRAFSHCESQTTVITYVEYLMIPYLCKPYELAEMWYTKGGPPILGIPRGTTLHVACTSKFLKLTQSAI